MVSLDGQQLVARRILMPVMWSGRRRQRPKRAPISGQRRGMTLIDVTVSMVLLAGVALGMGAFVSQYSRTATSGSSRNVAVDLATERLEEVRRATRYDSLETRYAGSESSIPGYSGFTRSTVIRRMGGGPSDALDYKLVTVTVIPPGNTRPVKKTTAISTF
jgi:type II secretory pathway pseudopilin PulG